MQLSTLVDLLEREMPGLADGPSTRNNLVRLYAERGCHEDAKRELAAGPISSAAGARVGRIAATPSRR